MIHGLSHEAECTRQHENNGRGVYTVLVRFLTLQENSVKRHSGSVATLNPSALLVTNVATCTMATGRWWIISSKTLFPVKELDALCSSVRRYLKSPPLTISNTSALSPALTGEQWQPFLALTQISVTGYLKKYARRKGVFCCVPPCVLLIAYQLRGKGAHRKSDGCDRSPELFTYIYSKNSCLSWFGCLRKGAYVLNQIVM